MRSHDQKKSEPARFGKPNAPRIPGGPSLFLASGFYSGYFPIASGTAATLVAMGLYFFAAPLNTPESFRSWLIFLLVVISIGIFVSDRAEKLLGQTDPHEIVIDEIIGYFVAMTLLPLTAPNLVGAFLLFRLFDVWKPFPIRTLQLLPGGRGVMADDLLAGVYACIVLHLVQPYMGS
ncbi:MAG: phosphatidylglycerophosphatase A [bacterium]